MQYQIRQTAKIYRNRNAGMLEYLKCTIFLILELSSIAVIPFSVNRVENVGLLAVVLTITFWIGFIFFFDSLGKIQYASQKVFIVTSGRSLYYVHFMTRNYGKEPITKIGQIIHNHQIIKAENKLRKERKRYLESDAFLCMVERVINGEGKPEAECVITRLNSPTIKRKGLSGIYIKYLDEGKGRWVSQKLLKSNEGYQEICELIQQKTLFS